MGICRDYDGYLMVTMAISWLLDGSLMANEGHLMVNESS